MIWGAICCSAIRRCGFPSRPRRFDGARGRLDGRPAAARWRCPSGLTTLQWTRGSGEELLELLPLLGGETGEPLLGCEPGKPLLGCQDRQDLLLLFGLKAPHQLCIAFVQQLQRFIEGDALPLSESYQIA